MTTITQYCDSHTNFNHVQFIDHNGQDWLTGTEIGEAIGLKHARTGIHKIYTRHSDEFTDAMTTVAPVATVDGKFRDVRIFSLRGAHLLAMLVQTPKAKQFRIWLLDMLEHNDQPTIDPKQLYRLQDALLKSNPRWQKIMQYRQKELNNTEISRLLQCSTDTIRREIHKMQDCGILQQPTQYALALEGATI